MAGENVEIVRELWRRFERFEFPFEAFDENVEWHTASDLPDREVCRGPAEVARMLAEGWETITDPGMEVEEVLQAGEQVVVRWHAWGKGRVSRAPLDWRETHLYELRDGRIAEVWEFRTLEEALKAAGAAG